MSNHAIRRRLVACSCFVLLSVLITCSMFQIWAFRNVGPMSTAIAAQDSDAQSSYAQTHVQKVAPKKPGNAIAVSALILTGGSGWQHVPGTASKQAKRSIMPPNTAAWKGYRKAHRQVGLTDAYRNRYHAECSATVSLAVRMSGVDDGFSCQTTASQYMYMHRSSKWQEVGVWNRRTGGGVALQPGDILITKKCRTGRNGHILIYIGNEIARSRFPDADGMLVESAEGTCWPSVTAKDDAKNGYPKDKRKFIVFRSTLKRIPDSPFKQVLNARKIKYSPEYA